MRWKITVATLLLTSGAVWNACAAESDDSDSYFPIWGDEARARGYSIPLPFVNLSYMNMRGDIMVDSITFSGLKLGNHPIPSDMFAIDAGHTREKSKTENLRLDMWVFPFLYVYWILGHTAVRRCRMCRPPMPTQRNTEVWIASSPAQCITQSKWRVAKYRFCSRF